MATQNPAAPPRLDAPGAGLPLVQSFVARYYLGPFVAGRSDWDENLARFEAINGKILKTIEGLSDAQLAQRALVPPQPGLEDSSRHWSIAMTLEHLAHVGMNVRELIAALSKGVVPPVEVDIAKVKPLGKMAATEAVAAFREFAATTRSFLQAQVGDRRSASALRHPWFGPFRAQQWQWLLAAHAGVHYKQIKEIKKQLEYV